MGLWWINHGDMCQLKTKARVCGNFLEGHQLVALVGITMTFFLPFSILWFLQWVAAKQVMLLRTATGTSNTLFLFKINNSKLENSQAEKVVLLKQWEAIVFIINSHVSHSLVGNLPPLPHCLNRKYYFISFETWATACKRHLVWGLLSLQTKVRLCACTCVIAAGEDWSCLSPTQALIKQLLYCCDIDVERTLSNTTARKKKKLKCSQWALTSVLKSVHFSSFSVKV